MTRTTRREAGQTPAAFRGAWVARVGRPARAWLALSLLALAACEEGQAGNAGSERMVAARPVEAGVSTPAQTAQLPSVDTNQTLTNSRETAVVRAAESVSPAVVAVHVLRTEQVRVSQSIDPFSSFFGFGASPFAQSETRRVPSLGSGFVVHPSGVILTNHHVIRGAEQILVTFPDGRDVPAELVGSDEMTDVAVLRIQAGGLVAVPVGSSSGLRIGEWVIAFGNPFGNLLSNAEPSVTVGVTSAVGRHLVPTEDDGGFYLGMIQTDAAINPGNSGGPLVNADGQVVGMNTSILSRSGGSEGMGFAIPIERALRIADDILQYGQVRRAWVGVNVEPDSADAFGRTRGVRVAGLSPDSPAGRSGIKPGERLLEVNGHRLVTPLDFDAALLDLRVGDEVTLTLDGRPSPIRVTAAESPFQMAERVRLFDGLELITLTPSIRQERRIAREAGALVVGTSQQVLDITGLREGDLIIGVGRQPIRSAEELSDLLRQVPARSRLQFVVERNGQVLASPEFRLNE